MTTRFIDLSFDRFTAIELVNGKFHQILKYFMLYREAIKLVSSRISFNVHHVFGSQLKRNLHAILWNSDGGLGPDGGLGDKPGWGLGYGPDGG
jgi:hypothetical protein